MRRKAEVVALRTRIEVLLVNRRLSREQREILQHMQDVLLWMTGWEPGCVRRLLSGEIPVGGKDDA